MVTGTADARPLAKLMNATSLQHSKPHWLLVGFDAALLGLGILLCFCGVEAGALPAVFGALFLALATWSEWPSLMRRVVCALLGLTWFSAAIWFCLSLGRRLEVPEGTMALASWRGWPFRYALASHCQPGHLDQFIMLALMGDILVGAGIGLVPVLIFWLTRRWKRTQPVTLTAAGSDRE